MRASSFIFGFILIMFSALISQDGVKEDVISSQEANYDGSSLTLKGNVVLEHVFGLMKAEEAVLDKAEESKDFPFSSIHLKNKVIVHPATSGTLTCAVADFNFEQLKAHFEGSGEGKVRFEEEIDSKNGKKHQISFEAPSTDMSMKAATNKKSLSVYQIDTLESNGLSTFTLDDRIIIESPKTIFRKANSANKKFAGEVLAIADNAHPCVLKNEDDRIESSHMQLDIASEMIALANASGLIDSFDQEAPLEFTSDKLLWDEKNNLLHMQGHVHCKEPGFGIFGTEHFIKVSFDKKEGKKELLKIFVQGPAKVKIEDLETKTSHDLYCPKSIDIDRKSMQAWLLASNEKPIRYVHPSGIIYADEAFIQYIQNEDGIKPEIAKLKGKIRMLASDEKSPKLCIADKLEFAFSDQKIILQADSGKRVLYWDKTAGVTISATEVHIVRDPQTAKEEVRGVGNVRFAFSEAEKELIKKHYPQFSK